MEDMIYVWDEFSTYCTREGLEETVELLGEGYEVLTVDEFHKLYPGDYE